ncbi:mitochondrial inner membrane protease subunit 1 isoform X3 [Rhodamnia argentea]|nr:mitochondrial inner membrane protease subunit 1 isoform X3 [Rhodamnia argentea]
MLPTLNLTGDVLLAERVSHRLGKVRPGDVVLVRSPVDPRKSLTKRVVAMGGDKVTFVVDPRNSDRVRTITVPRGHVWIQGDNIYASRDSRQFGAVPYGLVEGKILCRCILMCIVASIVCIKRTPCSPMQVWPLDGFGLLHH